MKKAKDFLKSIGLIIMYFILNALVSSLIVELAPKLGFSESEEKLFISVCLLIFEALLIALYSYILRDKLKGSFKDFKANYREYLPKCFKYWAVGFTALFIVNFIIVYFISGGIAPNEQANRELIDTYPLYLIVSASLFGPILEEMIFRLSFKGVIKKRMPYILTTGIIFGSMHVVFSLNNITDLFYILSYSSLGIALSAIYYDTDNILSSMLVHIAHNTITLLIILGGI